ncbi:hypothetical protein [Roseibium sp. M-1]
MGCRLILALAAWLIAGLLAPDPGTAQSKSFRLSAPDAVAETGFLKFLLPRFSLKTGIRIELVGERDAADVILLAAKDGLSAANDGAPVFSGLDETWFLIVLAKDNDHAVRFRKWLTGDIGRRTVDDFEENGKQLFTASLAKEKDVGPVILSGDATEGEKLAVLHCGRCHRVNEATRHSGIGSTPSFSVMRSFTDWQRRFEAFFSLNPHPSFTMIDGVTEPFDITRPPPIAPLELTLDDLEAILAFVSRIEPADLGAPIQYQ